MDCKAIIEKTGERCKRKAIFLGYCNMHYSQKILKVAKKTNWKIMKNFDKFSLETDENNNIHNV